MTKGKGIVAAIPFPFVSPFPIAFTLGFVIFMPKNKLARLLEHVFGKLMRAAKEKNKRINLRQNYKTVYFGAYKIQIVENL